MHTFWGTADFYVWWAVMAVLTATVVCLVGPRDVLGELRLRWLARRTARDIARMRRQDRR